MGLLDDAIREHLELKRQRGADASEVARQEREAFGPIQRTAGAVAPEDAAPAAPAQEPVADAGPVDELDRAPAAPEPDFDAPPVGGAVRADFDDEPPSGEALADFDDDLPPVAEPPRGGAVRATFDDEPDDLEWAEPQRPAPAPPEGEALERAGQPTAEYDVEDLERLRRGPDADDDDEPEVVPADEGEDVLEETPEFLSETPEHDRLWFEQRPPRDFDF